MKLIYIFAFFIFGNTQAQDDTVTLKKVNIFHRIADDGKLTVKTIGGTYARPIYWKKRDWLLFGGTMAGAGMLTFMDQRISEAFIGDKYKNRTFDALADAGDIMGQPEYNYPLMFTVWGAGVVFENEWLRDTGIMLFASVTTSGILQTLAKTVAGRARPKADLGAHYFAPFRNEPDFHSFPSGHTMLALSTTWVMARQIKFKPLKYTFYAVPVVIGLSRVYHRAHFPSDILLGSALGIACAESVIKLYPQYKKQLRDKGKGISMLPHGSGVRVVYQF